MPTSTSTKLWPVVVVTRVVVEMLVVVADAAVVFAVFVINKQSGQEANKQNKHTIIYTSTIPHWWISYVNISKVTELWHYDRIPFPKLHEW